MEILLLAGTGIILIGGYLLAYKTQKPVSVPDATGDSSSEAQPAPSPAYAPANIVIDPSNPATWPQGDKIWDVCRAIAFAEGYNVPGTAPQRCKNPGDISDGQKTFGAEWHGGSNVTTFPDHQTGWNWLYSKIKNILAGKSSVYDAGWSWNQFAQKYAGSWQNWVNNVTRELDVKPTDIVRDYFA